MKKTATVLLAILTLICSISFVACNKGTKYNLISVTGLVGVSVNTYNYNYIELKEDGTYYLENKVKMNGIITKQSGKYLIQSDGKMIISDSDNGNDFLLGIGESITCINGQITVSLTGYGYDNITMIYKA